MITQNTNNIPLHALTKRPHQIVLFADAKNDAIFRLFWVKIVIFLWQKLGWALLLNAWVGWGGGLGLANADKGFSSQVVPDIELHQKHPLSRVVSCAMNCTVS